MANVKFEQGVYPVQNGESVLDTLLEAGVEVPYGCKTGACQSCLMNVVSGSVPEKAMKGLKASWQAKNYFLACQCMPEADIEIARANDDLLKMPVTVVSKTMLNASVIQLKVVPKGDEALTYFPGQYMTLWANNSLKRCYSLASIPSEDDFLEFQIKHVKDGVFSGWVYEKLQEGDELHIQGPMGDCFYTPGVPDAPLLLVGVGTGQSPLKGILREAILQGHQGPIHFYSGAFSPEGLYDQEFFKALDDQYPNFHYTACVLNGASSVDHGALTSFVEGDVNELVKANHTSFKGYRSFLCGSEQRVRSLRKMIFLGGANMNDIYADAFVAT